MVKKKVKKSKQPRLIIRELYEAKKARLEKEGKTFTWKEFGYAMDMGNLEGENSSRSNIVKILKDDYNPTFKKMLSIAKGLDVNWRDLVED